MAPADEDVTEDGDDYGDIDPSIPSGTLAYWKARARQWEKRCRRAEREKTQLIEELAKSRAPRPVVPSARDERRTAALRGDLYPGTSRPPRGH